MYFSLLYYYGLTKNTLPDILKQGILIAKNEFECDSFNLMAIMDCEEQMLRDEGYMAADGSSQFYLINWSLGKHKIGPNDIGTILV